MCTVRMRCDVALGWLASRARGVYLIVGQPGGLASLVGCALCSLN
eukprot:SAG11_NODE_589_length_8326_cov_11.644099_12_plen_45_part_00